MSAPDLTPGSAGRRADWEPHPDLPDGFRFACYSACSAPCIGCRTGGVSAFDSYWDEARTRGSDGPEVLA